jgi:hypothetical protein
MTYGYAASGGNFIADDYPYYNYYYSIVKSAPEIWANIKYNLGSKPIIGLGEIVGAIGSKIGGIVTILPVATATLGVYYLADYAEMKEITTHETTVNIKTCGQILRAYAKEAGSWIVGVPAALIGEVVETVGGPVIGATAAAAVCTTASAGAFAVPCAVAGGVIGQAWFPHDFSLWDF